MYNYWDSDQWQRELAELQRQFPPLSHQTSSAGGMILDGILPVTQDLGYSVTIELGPNYPDVPPVVRCDPTEIEPIPDRHCSFGEACLCVRSELRLHWPRGSDIATFVGHLVIPFLDGQFYYDTHGHWPPGRGRDHGKPGILQAYREFCDPFGNDSDETVEQLMRLLARKNKPKGHETCPCGSRRKIRGCHKDAIDRLRQIVDPRHAATDLNDCFG